MKKIVLFLLIAAIVVIGFGGSVKASVDLPWSTTYNCSDWNTYSDPLNCDGLSKGGGWTTDAGKYEQITSAANNPTGGGGKGQRHWLGDGSNENSGGIRVEFNTGQTEFWMRWYMRHELGYRWNMTLSVAIRYKILYFNTGNPQQFIPDWNGWDGLSVTAGSPTKTRYVYSNGWDSVMVNGELIDGHHASDGEWHCYEIHGKMDTNGSDGIIQWWIDENLVMDINDAQLGTQPGGWTIVLIGSNKVVTDNGRDMYCDYDDIAISNTGYIGPLTTGNTTPPTRSNPQPNGTLGAGTTSTNIFLTTDINATCRYSNTSDTNYTDMPYNFTYTNSTNHSTEISGLENGLTYSYYIRCNSSDGYVNDDDWNITFSIAGHKADINDDGIINMPELMLYIARWKASDEVTKAEVFDARGIWFMGGVY